MLGNNNFNINKVESLKATHKGSVLSTQKLYLSIRVGLQNTKLKLNIDRKEFRVQLIRRNKIIMQIISKKGDYLIMKSICICLFLFKSETYKNYHH